MGDFEQKLDAARQWELKVARWARRRGWYVLPAYDFSGKGDSKAPKLIAPDGSRDLVLPDLLLLKFSECRWLEVKWKRRTDMNHKRGYLVTGINLRLWGHYLEVQSKVCGDVFLVFLHEQEREVRGDKLSNLTQYISHKYSSDKMGRSGMVFWRYDQIPRWGDLSMIERQEAG